jgi:co-chaperonin GroES (HSP10)
MTVDVNDPRATILGKRSGQKEATKNGIVVPHTTEEKPEEYEALDAGAVEVKEKAQSALM